MAKVGKWWREKGRGGEGRGEGRVAVFSRIEGESKYSLCVGCCMCVIIEFLFTFIKPYILFKCSSQAQFLLQLHILIINPVIQL